jgi:hypothetical protein
VGESSVERPRGESDPRIIRLWLVRKRRGVPSQSPRLVEVARDELVDRFPTAPRLEELIATGPRSFEPVEHGAEDGGRCDGRDEQGDQPAPTAGPAGARASLSRVVDQNPRILRPREYYESTEARKRPRRPSSVFTAVANLSKEYGSVRSRGEAASTLDLLNPIRKRPDRKNTGFLRGIPDLSTRFGDGAFPVCLLNRLISADPVF